MGWGLRFLLQSYWEGKGEVGPAVMKPYEYSQGFVIPFLRTIVPSGEIVIVTFNHPNGLVVPIRWLGYGESEPADPFSGPTSKLTEAPSTSQALEISCSDAIVIDTFLGGTFTIRETLPHSPSGIVDIDFDPYRLKLVNSSIKQGSIIWECTAIEEGSTQVIVDLIPSLPKPGELGLALVRTVYIINVYPPMTELCLQLKPGTLPGLTSTSAVIGRPPKFLDRVQQAVDIVRKTHPEAELVYVLATRLKVLPMSADPAKLSTLFCMLAIKDGTATVESKGLSEWEDPTFTNDLPPVGEKDFGLVGLHDIVIATIAMREAGIDVDIKEARLSQPFYQVGIPEQQPFYAFKLVDNAIVKVGAKDLHVIPEVGPEKEKLNGA